MRPTKKHDGRRNDPEGDLSRRSEQSRGIRIRLELRFDELSAKRVGSSVSYRDGRDDQEGGRCCAGIVSHLLERAPT